MPTATEREIVATRVFHAPRELVFRMWTDREHISNWWGPRGFTTTTYEMDVRPGGVWRHVMHGPDGTDYENEIVYREIAEPELLVYSHVSPPPFETIVTFTKVGDNTQVTARMLFESATLRDRVAREHGAVEGLHQTLERLEEQVSKMSADGSPEREFTISREFNAPRELVFKAWTEAERLAEWWGPKGFKIRVAKLDVRPGGIFHYSMTTPGSEDWWGRFVYREVVPPERIVFVNSFSDAEGGVTRAPFSPTFPLEVLSTITFTEHDGRTTITLRGVPLNASEEESKTFEGMAKSMQQGWSGTLDQLAEYLAKP
jgi:uncharacterized protein YndB with AHSA1/START domain